MKILNKINESVANFYAKLAVNMWLQWVITALVVWMLVANPPTTPYQIAMDVVSIGFQGLILIPMALSGQKDNKRLEGEIRKMMKELKDIVRETKTIESEEEEELRNER